MIKFLEDSLGLGMVIGFVGEIIDNILNPLYVISPEQNYLKGIQSILGDNTSSKDDEFVKEFVDLNGNKLKPETIELVMNENVVNVERCGQSLWQYFPSGIITPVTWLWRGKAMRYEFVIVNTENYICLLEMRIQTKTVKKFMIEQCTSEKNRKELRKKFLENRTNVRVMAKNNYIQNETMKFSTLCRFSNFALECWKKIPKNWFDEKKLSKLFARSMIYFSKPQLDEEEVLKSIFGLFTDKPILCKRIDLIFFGKMIYNVYSEEKVLQREKILRFIEIIRDIRNDKY